MSKAKVHSVAIGGLKIGIYEAADKKRVTIVDRYGSVTAFVTLEELEKLGEFLKEVGETG